MCTLVFATVSKPFGTASAAVASLAHRRPTSSTRRVIKDNVLTKTTNGRLRRVAASYQDCQQALAGGAVGVGARGSHLLAGTGEIRAFYPPWTFALPGKAVYRSSSHALAGRLRQLRRPGDDAAHARGAADVPLHGDGGGNHRRGLRPLRGLLPGGDLRAEGEVVDGGLPEGPGCGARPDGGFRPLAAAARQGRPATGARLDPLPEQRPPLARLIRADRGLAGRSMGKHNCSQGRGCGRSRVPCPGPRFCGS